VNAMGLRSSLPVRVYLQLVIAALTLFGLYHVLDALYLGETAVRHGKWELAFVFGSLLALLSLWSALVIRRARTLAKLDARRSEKNT
jgi:hypothetical protein